MSERQWPLFFGPATIFRPRKVWAENYPHPKWPGPFLRSPGPEVRFDVDEDLWPLDAAAYLLACEIEP